MMNLLPLIIDLNSELTALLNKVDANGWKRKILDKDENVEFAFKRLFLEDYKLINKENLGIEMMMKNENLIFHYNNDQHEFDAYFRKQEDKNIKKEYVSRWLSYQQIFNALNKQTLLQPKYYHPYLRMILSKLPFAFRDVNANIGDILKIEIVGDAGGVWTIKKEINGWFFCDDENYTALIYIDQQIAWLLFLGLIDVLSANQYYQINGDFILASWVLKLKLD